MNGTNGVSREQVLADWPLVTHLERIGVKLRGSGTQRITNRCAGKQHKPDHCCVTVKVDEQIWHCFGGLTKVLTRKGWRLVSCLGEVELLDGNGHWVKTELKSFGFHPVYEVQLSRDGIQKKIYATQNHGWITKRGNLLTTGGLSVGDYLKPCTLPHPTITLDPEWVRRGFIFGDGHLQDGQWMVGVNFEAPDKCEFANKWFADFQFYDYPSQRRYHGKSNGDEKTIPLFSASDSELASWLAGYFAADGSVSAREGASVISTTQEWQLELIQAIAARVGVWPGEVRAKERICFGKPSTLYQLALKMPPELTLRSQRLPNEGYTRKAWKVVGINENIGVQEVFCAEMPSTKSFAIEGMILTHNCNDCGTGGSIVDWLAIERNVSPQNVFKEMAQKFLNTPQKPTEPPAKEQIVATYDYTDENGELLYQVVRYNPKNFRQRQPDANGGWKWTMDGATRVPYYLPEVLKANTVLICEGEKDVETLRKLGYVATCNVGGAGKWLDAYSDLLKGKHVVVIPDNDLPGKNHGTQVIASLSGKAASAKLVPMPEPHKDVSDYVATFNEPTQAKSALDALIDKAAHALKPLPWLNMQELEARYSAMVKRMDEVSFDLGRFLPTLGHHVRKLIPGQLVVVLASTGVGKTAILQTMARAAQPLPTLFFELELPAEDMFERFVQMEIGCDAKQIEDEYKTLAKPIFQHYRGLAHILVCPDSGLQISEIESLIDRSELKLGRRPIMVFVDYIGLIQGSKSRSRYEAISEAAEQLKVIAKRTSTIVVMASQVHRPNPEKKKGIEVSLTDGKDSGSIENSAGVVMGAWRPEANTMMLRILKNTKGRTGVTIECNFDGSTMRITERALVGAP